MRIGTPTWILAAAAALLVAGCELDTSSGGSSSRDTSVGDTGVDDTDNVDVDDADAVGDASDAESDVGDTDVDETGVDVVSDTSDDVDPDATDTGTDADTALDTDTDTGPGPQPTCDIVDPHPSRLMSASGLSERQGEIQFMARDGNVLFAYTYRPSTWDGTGPVLFGIHGSGRGAELTRDRLAPTAERAGALLVAPLIDEERYPSFPTIVGPDASIPYDDGEYIPEHWAAPEDYLHSELEHLFEALREYDGFHACTYYLTGHSAGGQFTHRMMTFRPDARVERAVAVNAGWYTLPGFAEGDDENLFFPYGLTGSPWDIAHQRTVLGRPLTVLLGAEDLDPPGLETGVRDSPEANAQGMSRLERGHHYFAYAQAQAEALGTPFGWKMDVVTGAAHSGTDTFPSAAWYLFEAEGSPPCEASSLSEAADLRIVEVLVDPRSSDADPSVGDANGDGSRDPDDDEFVELLNTGDTPICLEDWVIHEARDEVRHRFPIGTELAPGEAIVVFGGGIPTGPFGGSHVQWAFFQGALGLTNAGDVLQLRAPDGSLHTALSWDDCSEAACADAMPCPDPAYCEHWTLDASDNQSVVLLEDGTWGLHSEQPESGGADYSPGVRTSGERY